MPHSLRGWLLSVNRRLPRGVGGGLQVGVGGRGDGLEVVVGSGGLALHEQVQTVECVGVRLPRGVDGGGGTRSGLPLEDLRDEGGGRLLKRVDVLGDGGGRLAFLAPVWEGEKGVLCEVRVCGKVMAHTTCKSDPR